MSEQQRMPEGWDVGEPPRWARRLVWQTLVVIAAFLVFVYFLRVLRPLLLWLLFALFLSLALEPAVNWLEKRGWRRGLSTALLLAVLGLFLVGMVLMVIPLFLDGVSVLIEEIPTWLDGLTESADDCCGIDISTEGISSALQQADVSVASLADDALAVLVGAVGNLVSGVFGAFTVGLFAFYLVAQAPKVRRSVLSLLPPERQAEVLYVWETAIDKTGGYVYSRLALALINGGLFFILLLVLGVPFALPLALFEGFVAAFIPIIGTYISAAVPALVALVTNGWGATAAIVAYALIYQQAENYWLSPRLSARTMSLHPAIALAAGTAGGLIGGLLWAFIALPVAATVQAAIGAYVEHHEVIESELTKEQVPEERERTEWRRALGRWGRRLRKT